MNSQRGPLRPTQLPSGHCLASSVHATFDAGCGGFAALLCVQEVIMDAHIRSVILSIIFPLEVVVW
jgi:hypothetical protein